MIETIATTISLASGLSIAVVLFRKIPALIKLSPQEQGEISFWKGIKTKIGESKIFPSPSPRKLLQKLLRKSKVITLKTENKISYWLDQLQQKQENGQSDGYWQELKNTISSETRNVAKDKK